MSRRFVTFFPALVLALASVCAVGACNCGPAEDPDKANALLSRAKSQLQGFPPSARAFTEKVQKGNETLYRARFAGLEEQSAQSACKALKKSGFACFTTKN